MPATRASCSCWSSPWSLSSPPGPAAGPAGRAEPAPPGTAAVRAGGRRRHAWSLRIAGGEERVRLIGIDTPETVKPDTPVECFGPEASAHLHGSCCPPAPRCGSARDVEARDRYGRLLALPVARRRRPAS